MTSLSAGRGAARQSLDSTGLPGDYAQIAMKGTHFKKTNPARAHKNYGGMTPANQSIKRKAKITNHKITYIIYWQYVLRINNDLLIFVSLSVQVRSLCIYVQLILCQIYYVKSI